MAPIVRPHTPPRLLNIYRNQKIADAGLAHLRGLTALETLHLDGSRVTDAGLDFLSAMNRLQELDIDGTPVGNEGIVKLKALPRLKQVFVQNSRTTAEGVAELQKHLPKVNVNIGTHPGSFGR
jgi:Leucine Rich repeat